MESAVTCRRSHPHRLSRVAVFGPVTCRVPRSCRRAPTLYKWCCYTRTQPKPINSTLLELKDVLVPSYESASSRLLVWAFLDCLARCVADRSAGPGDCLWNHQRPCYELPKHSIRRTTVSTPSGYPSCIPWRLTLGAGSVTSDCASRNLSNTTKGPLMPRKSALNAFSTSLRFARTCLPRCSRTWSLPWAFLWTPGRKAKIVRCSPRFGWLAHG